MLCENTEEPCQRTAIRIFARENGDLRVCKRCFHRYRSHGDGRKLAPWEAQREANRKKEKENV